MAAHFFSQAFNPPSFFGTVSQETAATVAKTKKTCGFISWSVCRSSLHLTTAAASSCCCCFALKLLRVRRCDVTWLKLFLLVEIKNQGPDWSPLFWVCFKNQAGVNFWSKMECFEKHRQLENALLAKGQKYQELKQKYLNVRKLTEQVLQVIFLPLLRSYVWLCICVLEIGGKKQDLPRSEIKSNKVWNTSHRPSTDWAASEGLGKRPRRVAFHNDNLGWWKSFKIWGNWANQKGSSKSCDRIFKEFWGIWN